MVVIEELCGESDACIKELYDLASEVERIDDLIKRSGFKITLVGDPPLVKRLSNEIKSELRGLLERLGFRVGDNTLSNEENLDLDSLYALFIARRALRISLESIPRDYSDNWSLGYCPICGLHPISFTEETREEETMSRQLWVAFCLCGHSWIHNPMTCPRCRTSGAESFNITIIGRGVRVYKCTSCGYQFTVFPRVNVSNVETNILPLLGYIAINASSSVSQEQ